MNFPDTRYCLNNGEKTSKTIQYGLFLMGFNDDKICIPGKLARCEIRLSQPTDKFIKSLQKCLKYRSINNRKAANKKFQRFTQWVFFAPLANTNLW